MFLETVEKISYPLLPLIFLCITTKTSTRSAKNGCFLYLRCMSIFRVGGKVSYFCPYCLWMLRIQWTAAVPFRKDCIARRNILGLWFLSALAADVGLQWWHLSARETQMSQFLSFRNTLLMYRVWKPHKFYNIITLKDAPAFFKAAKWVFPVSFKVPGVFVCGKEDMLLKPAMFFSRQLSRGVLVSWVVEESWSYFTLEGSENRASAVLHTWLLIFMHTVVVGEGFWLVKRDLKSKNLSVS